MVEPENRLVYQLVNSGAEGDREEQRLKALLEFGLLQAQTIPVFEEATQTAAELLDAPICILGFIDCHRHAFKAAVGLSRLGLMNKIAQERQLPREESFCSDVVEQHQVLAIADTLLSADFAQKILVQRYGIRAYLGVPLIDTAGNCLGSIAIMEQSPRTFSPRDIQCLELIARWSMSEFERQWLVTSQQNVVHRQPDAQLILPPHTQPELPTNSLLDAVKSNFDSSFAVQTSTLHKQLPEHIVPETLRVKLELLDQIVQELRTPLTSVLGMATVLAREIYGPLMSKQKEYLEVIQNSGRYLLSLVNDISELGAINGNIEALNLTAVDIEMLCQQVSHTLEDAAKRREHQLRLFVERDRNRTWFLDKEKARQLLYHLIFNVIQSATTGSTIRIHVFQSVNKTKKIAISVSHPWLGEGLTEIDPCFCQLPSTAPKTASNQEWMLAAPSASQGSSVPDREIFLAAQRDRALEVNTIDSDLVDSQDADETSSAELRERGNLRLALSCHLAQLHGGEISIELIPDSGYRYSIALPDLEEVARKQKAKNNI